MQRCTWSLRTRANDLKHQIINRVDGMNARLKKVEEGTNGSYPPASLPPSAEDERPIRAEMHSITEEDWADSPSGVHRDLRVTKQRWIKWQREQAVQLAASRWKKMWKWARWIVAAIIGGALAYGGEQIMKYFIHHV